jgi:hypothetical protein
MAGFFPKFLDFSFSATMQSRYTGARVVDQEGSGWIRN